MVDIFRRGEDVYTYTAGRLGSDNRQFGKVLVLATGFGMGPGRFQATALNYGVALSLPEAEAAVMGWRSLNSRVVDYWWALHRAAMRVVRGPAGSRETVGCVTFARGRDSLDVILPSGRALIYRDAKIVAHPEHGHPELVYRSVEMGRWSWARSWPGKLTENVVQAIARDVMAEALILARRRKVPLIATVHDELVAEVEEARAPDLKVWMLWAMNRSLNWAPGLPVAAAATIGRRYRKDA
jgi:DNA polymerase